jgi:MFS family permease
MRGLSPPDATSVLRSPAVIILAGCLIAMVGFGVRSSFGVFLEPMTLARGWDRQTFSLAMALQNLLWGLGVPLASVIADRYGPSRVLAAGAVVYAAGVWGMTQVDTGFGLTLTAGILTGLGVAFTAFSIILASIAKAVGPARRSLALGLGTAASSFGQVVFSPIGFGFIGAYGWETALTILAFTLLAIAPLGMLLPLDTGRADEPPSASSIGAALREATAHRGYGLLTLGFFVCGFHVAFITVHFPAYVRDLGLEPAVGAYAIALVGLFNIVGSFLSGAAGQRWSKKGGLALIYFARAVAISALLLAPKTEATILLFAAVMGILWLSTVPLTSGIVAQVFGVRYMATLFGIVFFSHQLGSFTGVWLAGYLYDTTGSYDLMWYAAIALGLVATALHLPIDERPLARAAAPAT